MQKISLKWEGGAMKRIRSYGLGLLGLLAMIAVPAGAQSQGQSGTRSASSGQSLGDYARQVRKTEPGGKPKVFDNDNLPKGEPLSVVGKKEAPPTESSANEAQGENAATPAGEEKSATQAKTAAAPEKTNSTKAPEDAAARETAWKQWGDKIKAQEQQIELLTREFDVLQREYQIRAAAMYADAGNRLRNQADWDKQDAQYKQQIADKQKALDDAKQKLEDLQEEARKAGAPTSVREQ